MTRGMCECRRGSVFWTGWFGVHVVVFEVSLHDRRGEIVAFKLVVGVGVVSIGRLVRGHGRSPVRTVARLAAGKASLVQEGKERGLQARRTGEEMLS